MRRDPEVEFRAKLPTPPWRPVLITMLVVFITVFVIALLVECAFSGAAHASECLSENRARQAWPRAHLWWTYSHHHRGDRRCWFVRDHSSPRRGVPAPRAAGHLHGPVAQQTAEVSGPQSPTPRPPPSRSPVNAVAANEVPGFEDRWKPTTQSTTTGSALPAMSVPYVRASTTPWVDTFEARWLPVLALIGFAGYDALERALERRYK